MNIWETNLCVETSPGSLFLDGISSWLNFRKNGSNGVRANTLLNYNGVLYKNRTGW